MSRLKIAATSPPSNNGQDIIALNDSESCEPGLKNSDSFNEDLLKGSWNLKN